MKGGGRGQDNTKEDEKEGRNERKDRRRMSRGRGRSSDCGRGDISETSESQESTRHDAY